MKFSSHSTTCPPDQLEQAIICERRHKLEAEKYRGTAASPFCSFCHTVLPSTEKWLQVNEKVELSKITDANIANEELHRETAKNRGKKMLINHYKID
jgi:hypothetical protein